MRNATPHKAARRSLCGVALDIAYACIFFATLRRQIIRLNVFTSLPLTFKNIWSIILSEGQKYSSWRRAKPSGVLCAAQP